jgi:hypothetical protein
MPVGHLLELGDGVFGVLAGLGIDLAEGLLAEIRVPSDAVLIDDHVMRLDRRARQIVFGDDDAGRPPGRARQRLEREFPRISLVEVNRGEVVGALAEGALAGIATLFQQPLRQPPLRVQGGRLVGIARHALDDVDEGVRVVLGFEHPLERVAAHAIVVGELLLRGAGRADDPFGVGELR